MKYTLAYVDNQLCVRAAWPLDSEPFMRVLYWLVGRVVRSGGGPTLDIHEIVTSGVELTHRWAGDPFYYYKNGSSITFHLFDDVQTQAIKIENVPIPPPPARGKPIRWYQGRWQRELKRGWVDC